MCAGCTSTCLPGAVGHGTIHASRAENVDGKVRMEGSEGGALDLEVVGSVEEVSFFFFLCPLSLFA